MPVFVTSKSQARLHGVYAMEATPPATITATGTGTVVVVDAFPWGPAQALTYYSDPQTMMNSLAPPGMSRTTGWLSLICKQFARVGVIRVTASGATAATATLASSVPTNIMTVTLKCVGTAGNSVTWAVSAASDGDANHFKLTVSVTSASGTTTDTLDNINVSGTGADVLPSAVNLSKCLLVGSVTKLVAGRPANGTGSFSTGSDGSVLSSDWIGVQGTANRGVALAEGDKTVDFVVAGDMGNSLRAAVNTGFVAHADYMTDRMAVINGPSGQTAAQAQADVASYRSLRCIYVDPWVYVLDDVDGTKRLVPSGSFAAAAASLLSPSTSIAWKGPVVQRMLQQVNDLEVSRGILAADNTDAGIVTMVREDLGGYTFESAKNTYHPLDATRGSIKRTRMGHFLGRSISKSLRPYVDSPNIPANQQDEIDAVADFLNVLKTNAKIDANNLAHIVDFSMADPKAVNAQSAIDAGEFTIGANIKISSDQEKIFFLANFGETVKINVQL